MDAVDNFLKFADECEAMAKRTSDREGKHAWRELAERWRRCAEERQLKDAHQGALHHARQARQHQQPAHG